MKIKLSMAVLALAAAIVTMPAISQAQMTTGTDEGMEKGSTSAPKAKAAKAPKAKAAKAKKTKSGDATKS